MTTRMQLIVTDDWEEHNDGSLVDIGDDGEKVIISVDGRVRELDLTAKNAAGLRGVMRPWIEAGHEPNQAPQPPVRPEPKPRPKGQGRRRELPGTRDFYRGLREWAAASNLEVPMAGRNDAKKNYVYDKLLGPYLSWLEREAHDGRDGGVAAAQLAIAGQLGLVPDVSAGT
jgi:hypothetical protein